MTTKEQERKALAQIKKIVEGLGKDSYIGTAFEGCFEVAEQNIENDWACSMKQKVETAEQACDLRREEAHKLREENEKLKKLLEETSKQLQERAFMAQEMAHRKAEAEDTVEELRKGKWNLGQENFKLKEQIGFMEQEVIKLKAKLYDLMTK